MNSFFGNLAERIEHCLFHETVSIEDSQFRAFMNYFDDNYTVPLKFLKYLQREIKLSLVLNILLSVICGILIPYYISHLWTSNPCLTAWLTTLTLLNWVIIWPKLIILFRINKINAIENSSTGGYHMWALLRSKLYKRNHGLSKYIFCTYFAGMVLIFFSRGGCRTFFWSCAGLLIFFILRLVLSFVKFNNTFESCQNVDMIFEYLEGNANDKVTTLKLMEYKDFQLDPKLKEQNCCPVCYENYGEECLLKIMECPGNHVFHQKCIDTWLIKSEKCPMCNLSVFHQRECHNGKCK